MRAAVYEKYGPAEVVEIKNVDRPHPNDDEVLVQIHATSVTTADWRLRASAFPTITWLPGRLIMGVFAPRNKVLGGEFAGRVVSIGSNVTEFKLGDEVFGFAESFGAHAEYIAVPATGTLVKKPSAISYEEAAAVPFGALSALQFLRDFGNVQAGQDVLVLGASGGVGVFAVQIAKLMGAKVTGVTSTANVDLVRSLGADHVIDYRNQDFAKSGLKFDVVIDPAGITTAAKAKKVLRPNGTFVPLEISFSIIMAALRGSMFGGQQVKIGISGTTKPDLKKVAQWLASGAMQAVIDSTYAFEDIRDAHRKVEGRHKTGAVVVTLPQPKTLTQAA